MTATIIRVVGALLVVGGLGAIGYYAWIVHSWILLLGGWDSATLTMAPGVPIALIACVAAVVGGLWLMMAKKGAQ